MKQYAITFKVGTKEQINSMFRGLFGTATLEDGNFRIVGNDPGFSGSTSSLFPYIWGPQKYSVDWVVVNNHNKIVAYIKFVDTPGNRRLIFECADGAESALAQIMPEIIKSLEISGFCDLDFTGLNSEESYQAIDNIPKSPEISRGSVEDKSSPWLAIPDHSWDRMAVRMFCEGYDRSEIGEEVGVAPRVVTNRLCFLRSLYPGVVPYAKQIRKSQRRNV